MSTNMNNLNKSIFKTLLQYTWKFTDHIVTNDLVNTTAQIDINVYQLVVKDEFSRIVFFSNWEDLGISTFENKTLSLFNTKNDSEVEFELDEDD